MQFGLIIIGDEILSGKRADKHLAKAIELLSARGLQLAYAHYVGDDPDRITDLVGRAFSSGDVVFSFGGIGATPDDHTRQCAARALGLELVLNPDAKELIQERMRDIALEQALPYEPDNADSVRRLNMGMFPQGARIIPNPYNKVPGFFCTRKGEGVDADAGGVYFVPGFPVMAWPMVEWVLDTHYAHLFARHAWREQSVIVFGAMEAAMTPLMEQLEAQFSVKVFSLPSVDHPEFGRHVELGVKGDPVVVTQAFQAMVDGLRRMHLHLGPELVR